MESSAFGILVICNTWIQTVPLSKANNPGILAIFYDDVTDKNDAHVRRMNHVRMRTYKVSL